MMNTDIERIGDQHALMMQYVESLARPERTLGELERLDPRKTSLRKEYAKSAFRPDLYVVEPAALDDLELAKARRDEVSVEKMRSIIRAMSWASHGRTDGNIAANHVETFLKEASAAEHRASQTGFEFAHPDVAEWSRVLNALKKIECRGDVMEKPTLFIEKQIMKTWKELLGHNKDVAKINERIIGLRYVRDQLYYQLLYPKHCMYAQRSTVY